MLRETPIKPTLDFSRNGVQHGWLKLPWSRDDSAWGALMIPICQIKNGSGPTALLTGGNHGDEYEGMLALAKLAQNTKADAVNGRIIIVPMMNHPACLAARRTSPIDGGNLNRSFPGRPDGTVTEKIADYFERYLLPMADFVLDLHSGGKTLEFLPFAAHHILPDKQQQAQCEAAAAAFAAPYSLRMLEIDSTGMYDSAAEAQGKVFVTTELGGGGSSTAKTLAIAQRGVRNLLIHAGIVQGALQPSPSVWLEMPDDDCFISSEHEGLLEYCRDLGEQVSQGEPLVRIYSTRRSDEPPAVYSARRSGLLVARHFPGLVQTGDTLAVIAQIV